MGRSLYNSDTETYTYTPDQTTNDSDSIDFVVTDGNGGNTIASKSINITAVNDAPIATFSTAQATSEGSVSLTGQLTATDVDANETLSYAFSGDNAVAGLEIKADGSWSFDPSVDAYNDLAKGENKPSPLTTPSPMAPVKPAPAPSPSISLAPMTSQSLMSLTMSPQQKTALTALRTTFHCDRR